MIDYQRINFESEPSEKTPLSAENLNHMEDGIVDNNLNLNDHSNKLASSQEYGHVKVDGVTIQSNDGLISVNFGGIATEDYVKNAINNASLGGESQNIDLSIYALKSDLDSKVSFVAGKSLSTNDYTNEDKLKLNSIEEGAQKNPDLSEYLKQNDIADLAKKSEIPTNYLTPSDLNPYATKDEVDKKAYKSEVQDMINNIPKVDLSNYATEDYVKNAINQAELNGSDQEVDLSVYALKSDLENKVNSEQGKGLSTNDFTNSDKAKLDGLKNTDLSQVNLDLSNKVDKINGKSLSTNDYTTVEKNKLSDIQEGADKTPDLSVYAEKKDLTKFKVNQTETKFGELIRIEVNAVDGFWTADLTSYGFTSPPTVLCVIAQNSSSALADRLIPSLSHEPVTTTTIKGTLAGATSLGLVGSSLVEKSGKVFVTIVSS